MEGEERRDSKAQGFKRLIVVRWPGRRKYRNGDGNEDGTRHGDTFPFPTHRPTFPSGIGQMKGSATKALRWPSPCT